MRIDEKCGNCKKFGKKECPFSIRDYNDYHVCDDYDCRYDDNSFISQEDDGEIN